MILALVLIALILAAVLYAAVSANRVLKADLAESEADLSEAENDIEQLEGRVDGLNRQVDYYADTLPKVRKQVSSLTGRLIVSELNYALLNEAGRDLIASSDAYIDQLEGEVDDLSAALGHSLALNAIQDVEIAALKYENETAQASVQHLLDTMVPVEELATLTNAVATYDAVADKFIAKVESGRARSTETYEELKAAREWNAPPIDNTPADADLAGDIIAPFETGRDFADEAPLAHHSV